MNTSNEQKRIKLRFLLMYGISLVLIFVVVTAFFQKKEAIAQGNASQASESEGYFIQFDTLLHSKLDQLDNMYTLFLKAPQNSSAEVDNFFAAKNLMAGTVDSIAQQASVLKGGSKKAAMEMIVSRYKTSLDIRSRLVGQLSSTPNNKLLPQPLPNNTDSVGSATDAERLRNIVAQKEQQIMMLEQKALADLKEKNDIIIALQNQLRQKSPGIVTNNPSAADSEWKQKYSYLKASYDKIAESENTLRNAYKTVAEDNRRLLVQIQSIKKD